jgi:phosphate transport system substrate-binding protein
LAEFTHEKHDHISPFFRFAAALVSKCGSSSVGGWFVRLPGGETGFAGRGHHADGGSGQQDCDSRLQYDWRGVGAPIDRGIRQEHPAVKFDLETKATGYGMAALRVGLCDIAAASRPAITADLELAKDANVEMNEYVLGAYCAAVVVHASNPVTNLTRDQVRGIFTGKIQNWSEVGGPDLAVQVHIRDAISGTHLGFKELAMSNEDYAPRLKLYTNYTGIVTAVAANPGAIGFSGLTSAAKEGVKAVAIDGVLPARQTANDGTYPIARVLRFYTNKAKESPDTKQFIEFVQSSRGQSLMAEMDFAPRP